MAIERTLKQLQRCFEKYGTTVLIKTKSGNRTASCFVQTYARNFTRHYGGDDYNAVAGVTSSGDLVAFFAPDDGLSSVFRAAEDDVVVVYQGVEYYVVADCEIPWGGEPVYMWAVLRRVAQADSGYYDDIGGGDSE